MTPLQYLVKHQTQLVQTARNQMPEALKADAEDVVQDVALRFIAYEPPRVDEDKLAAYVGKAVRNTCIALCRDVKHRMELRQANDDIIRGTYGYDGSSDAPEEMVIVESETVHIYNELSDIERQVFINVLTIQRTYKEASKELGISEEAVRKHVSRIKKKFNGDTQHGN